MGDIPKGDVGVDPQEFWCPVIGCWFKLSGTIVPEEFCEFCDAAIEGME